MPSPDDHAQQTHRPARRSLGRGPGASGPSGVAGARALEQETVSGADPEQQPDTEGHAVGRPVPGPEAEPESVLVPGLEGEPASVPVPGLEGEPASVPVPGMEGEAAAPEGAAEPVPEPTPESAAEAEPEGAPEAGAEREDAPEGGPVPERDSDGEPDKTVPEQQPEEAQAGKPVSGEPPEAEGPAVDRADPPADPPAGNQADDGDPVRENGGPGERGSGEEEAGEQEPDDGRFKVVLDNFEGPFDLLLQLISKHKLDVTEVALSKVTDEFMAYIHAMGPDWDLDQTTEFLVVASTLLDLKAARLLPAAEVEDEADLALLEARDLLFARLLQYRAYKEIAGIFAERMEREAHRHPRTVGLEPHHAELLPEVAISIGPEGFAKLAVKAMRPKPKPQVYVEHIHAPLVSVREQAEVVVARLRELGEVSFQQLTEDAEDTLTVVARFLALLELYRERAVDLEQQEALGSIMVRWSGEDGREPLVTDEFDREPGQQDDKPAPRQEPGAQEEMQA